MLRKFAACVFFVIGDLAFRVSQGSFLLSDRIQGDTTNGPWGPVAKP